MKRSLTVAIALLLSLHCFLPVAASSQQTSKKYADKLRGFEEFGARQMAEDRIPGLTTGFIKGNETWVKGFGYADLENRIPAKAESAYRLASVTKTMTGAAIVQLAERGKLSLDGEIQTYVPYYPKQKWPVTVRQLLVHLGGGQTGSGIGPEYVTPKGASINANGIASARAMSQIARALAGINRTDAGIEWLLIAAELYPKDAALYDTLGDMYLKKGEKQQAIEAYRKAIAVEPDFPHAKEMLKKLPE